MSTIDRATRRDRDTPLQVVRLSAPLARFSAMRPTRRCSLAMLLIPLAACAADPPEGATLPFNTVASTQQLMASILDPAAEVYWDAVGWIVDASGTTEIRPSSDEEWDAVRNAAFVITESGNLLMMDGRAEDDGAWMGMARSMIDVGQLAIEAAEARNEQAVFDVGAEVYFACTNCHAAYAIQTLNPADRPN